MHGKKQVMRKYMMDVRTDWDTKAGGDWSTQEEEALLSRLSIYTSVSTCVQ